MGKIIDGKAIAKVLRQELKSQVDEMAKKSITPKLTVIIVGENPASKIYVKNKERAAKKIGIKSIVERYPENISEEKILTKIDELNHETNNHGILVQLPLPKHIDEKKVLNAIDPKKDVDGFHPINIGKLVLGENALLPCTPNGCIHLIESTGIDITSKNAVIVGRSNIVGKPISFMLLKKNATVTICHSKTIDLADKVRSADILIAAIGRPEFIRGEWIKEGSIVIDVGINRLENGKIVGDVQFDIAQKKAAYITPVPGGVGPMTIAMLMKNTISSCVMHSE